MWTKVGAGLMYFTGCNGFFYVSRPRVSGLALPSRVDETTLIFRAGRRPSWYLMCLKEVLQRDCCSTFPTHVFGDDNTDSSTQQRDCYLNGGLQEYTDSHTLPVYWWNDGCWIVSERMIEWWWSMRSLWTTLNMLMLCSSSERAARMQR